MNRRQFIRYSTLGGGSFILNLGLHQPQQADAFFFLLNLLARGLSRYHQIKRQQFLKDRREVMLAEREFVVAGFTNVAAVAEVEDTPYQFIVGAQKSTNSQKIVTASQQNINLGNQDNAFSFPRIENGRDTVATVTGPATVGMTFATQYLKEHERLSYPDIQAGILPSLSGGGRYSDMRNWQSDSDNLYPTRYSNEKGVRIRYEAVNPRPGGHGIIYTTVQAHYPIRIPPIRVNFA